MSLLSRKNLTLVLLTCFLVASAPARAARYTLDTSVDQDVVYDSNIVLRPVNEEDGGAYMLSPKAKLAASGDAWAMNLNTDLIFSKFSNGNYNSDDQIVDLSARRFSQNQSWQLTGEIRREGTRSNTDTLEPVLADSRTVATSLRPSWTRLLNEKNTLSVGANWLEMEYDSRQFSDYEQYGVDATWIRQLDSRLNLQVNVYQSRFDSGVAPSIFADPDLSLTSSETIGLSTGLTRQFNEQLSGSINIGTRQVDTKTRFEDCLQFFLFFCVEFGPGTFETDSSGFTSSASLDYAGDTWSGSFSLGRSISPSGVIGELLETDNVSINYSRPLRQNIFFDLKITFDSLNAIESNNYERDIWVVVPAVRWQFEERWALTTSLRHRNRATLRSGLDIEADGTQIVFKIRYKHPRASWSR